MNKRSEISRSRFKKIAFHRTKCHNYGIGFEIAISQVSSGYAIASAKNNFAKIPERPRTRKKRVHYRRLGSKHVRVGAGVCFCPSRRPTATKIESA